MSSQNPNSWPKLKGLKKTISNKYVALNSQCSYHFVLYLVASRGRYSRIKTF